MSDIDEHPDFATAQFQAMVVFDLADHFRIACARQATRDLWGDDAVARFDELLGAGTELQTAIEQVDGEWMAKPRKPFQGFLNLDG